VLLLVEVAESSLDYDRGVKIELYNRFAIPEVWLVDLRGERVEVYRTPSPETYRDVQRRVRGEHVAPAAFPEVTASWADGGPGEGAGNRLWTA
jgi:Uma2 family endonuclease